MSEPTQRQVDSDLEASMDLFQRADVGKTDPLTPRQPKKLLLAFDGSTQDGTVLAMGRQLQQRTHCATAFVFVPPSPESSMSAELRPAMEELNAEEFTGSGEHNYDRILTAVKQSSADFLIVPCPFGRDLESVGADSTGSVIDVLTARLTVPFIAVRRPGSPGDDPTNHVRLVLTGANLAAESAACYAAGVARPGGRLDMLLLVEASFFENFRLAMQSIDPDKTVSYEELEHALARSYGRLHAKFQRTATAHNFTYELLIRHEDDESPITPGDPKTHPALIVLALERNHHDSQSEVHDYIRRSPHAVLVVSVE